MRASTTRARTAAAKACRSIVNFQRTESFGNFDVICHDPFARRRLKQERVGPGSGGVDVWAPPFCRASFGESGVIYIATLVEYRRGRRKRAIFPFRNFAE